MPKSNRLKLFAGIELDDGPRDACAGVAERLERSGLRARFEPPEKLHITLAFLGWVDAQEVESILAALADVAKDRKPFTIALDKIGAFPQESKPRVVWIGARDQGSAFRELAQALRDRYSELGFGFTKPVFAHVTLARVKDGLARLTLLDVDPIKTRVRSITLFESLPAGRTTRYEVRARFPLK